MNAMYVFEGGLFQIINYVSLYQKNYYTINPMEQNSFSKHTSCLMGYHMSDDGVNNRNSKTILNIQ